MVSVLPCVFSFLLKTFSSLFLSLNRPVPGPSPKIPTPPSLRGWGKDKPVISGWVEANHRQRARVGERRTITTEGGRKGKGRIAVTPSSLLVLPLLFLLFFAFEVVRTVRSFLCIFYYPLFFAPSTRPCPSCFLSISERAAPLHTIKRSKLVRIPSRSNRTALLPTNETRNSNREFVFLTTCAVPKKTVVLRTWRRVPSTSHIVASVQNNINL